MSDPYLPDPNDADQEEDGNETNGEKDNLKALRAKARQADELAAKLAALERNEMFRTAGIDPGDPRARYFVKGYDGELNVDAIKAAATEGGYLSQPDPQHPSSDGMERIVAATAGGQAPPPTGWQEAMNEAERITDPQARTDAILSVCERFQVPTTRSSQ